MTAAIRAATILTSEIGIDAMIISRLCIFPIYGAGKATPARGLPILWLSVGRPGDNEGDVGLVPLVKFGRMNLDDAAGSDRHSLSDR
jgi:hypothetical protein